MTVPGGFHPSAAGFLHNCNYDYKIIQRAPEHNRWRHSCAPDNRGISSLSWPHVSGVTAVILAPVLNRGASSTPVRMNGQEYPRTADRTSWASSSREPPRAMRSEPAAAGSIWLSLVYDPYLSWHRSHTFPCMSCNRHGFGSFVPSGCAYLNRAAQALAECRA